MNRLAARLMCRDEQNVKISMVSQGLNWHSWSWSRFSVWFGCPPLCDEGGVRDEDVDVQVDPESAFCALGCHFLSGAVTGGHPLPRDQTY